ncbi:MAG: leucine-rich repeat protein, partial [Acutalibacteraceae bacterium]
MKTNKTTKYKIIATILAVIIALSAITVLPASAEEATYLTYGDFGYYVNDDNTVTINDYKGTEKTIVYPEKIDEKTVTDIVVGDYKTVSKLVIPACVTNIYTTLPKNNHEETKTSPAIFYENSLARKKYEIEIDPNNQSYIVEDGILYNKEKTFLITATGTASGHIDIPNTVTKIEKSAFAHSNVTSAFIPMSVTTIEGFAFGYWDANQTIYIEADSPQEGWYKMCFDYDWVTVNAEWYCCDEYEEYVEFYEKLYPTIFYSYDKDTPVSSIKFGTSSLTVGKDKKISHTVEKYNPIKSNKKIIWTTGDKSIATVSVNTYYTKVTVKGVKEGTTKIVAKNSDGSVIKEIPVTVTKPATSVKLNKTSVKVSKGKEATVKAISIGGGKYGDGIIKWYTSKKATMKVLNTSKD